MKLIKIKIPSGILKEFGFLDIFQEVDSIEVVQIYQYDQKNFFSLQKIILKRKEVLDKILKKYFNTTSFQLLETKGDMLLCIMKQRKTSGFWPLLFSGNWALIPPISINAEHVIFSLLAKEDAHLPQILNLLHRIKSFEILSIGNPTNLVLTSSQSTPQLTTRQREIMTFASNHGFYDIPKKISIYELAEQFHITPSGVNNHIQKAERALMKFYFG
jgi:predicted DNA binding protein